MVGLDAPATLILTLPRREAAAGLVSAGAVFAREAHEWEALARQELPFGEGSQVRFASLTANKVQYGTVVSRANEGVRVQFEDEFRFRVFPRSEQCLIVPRTHFDDSVESRLSPCLPFLNSAFGNIRARSFCIRTCVSAVIAGVESTLRSEWEGFPLGTADVNGTLAHVLRSGRTDRPGAIRSVCVSDRLRSELQIPFDAVFVMDSERSWRRWGKSFVTQKRVIIVDRSKSTFDAFIEQLQGDADGYHLQLPDHLLPPFGIEAYAYHRTSRGSF